MSSICLGPFKQVVEVVVVTGSTSPRAARLMFEVELSWTPVKVCICKIGNVLPNWKWNFILNGPRHMQKALLHHPHHYQYTHIHTPSQWDQQKGIFEEWWGINERGISRWVALSLCVCICACACMRVSAELATWVSAELWLGRGTWWVCLGGTRQAGRQRAAAGHTEPEDDWADRHVRQVCIEEPSQGNDRSGS